MERGNNMKKRNSFLFYYSYYDAVKELSAEEQGRMYKIIVDYAMLQIEPTLTGVEAMLFKLMKPNLDASIRKWQNGSKGGRPPKAKKTETKPKRNLDESKPKPRRNLDETLYIKEQEKEQEKEQKQEQEFEQTEQTASDSSRVEFYLDLLNSKVDKLVDNELLDIATANRLKELFKRVADEPEVRINKTTIANYSVLEKFINLFAQDENDTCSDIVQAFSIIDEKADIKNKVKYAMGIFYNKSCGY